jgi:cellulose synthase/poly-beta-1,6-N-acetylglucosamine synthase-like glycosyltransferase
MESVFFLSFMLIAYPYVLFPLIMVLLCKVLPVSWSRDSSTPMVSIIISVYNEEQVIKEKIRNTLDLEYDSQLLEILVVSDGSTDGTHDIVQSVNDSRVSLKVFPERAGKTECLNRVVPEARGDIVLFTDANSMFPVHVLKNIVRNFADDKIGLVTGWTKYRTVDGGEETTGLYARMEKVTKQGESLVSSCVGADGAIFAIRKELYKPLEVFDINDFVIPLNVIAQHKRVILDPDVYCYEEPTEGGEKGFLRQARISNRTLGALWRGRHFINPFRYGTFSLFLLSHKIIRFLVPLFFVGCLVMSLLLAQQDWFYALFFIAQLGFVGLGVFGLKNDVENRLINLSAFFLLTISAQMLGWIRFLTGRVDTVWTPQR